MKKMKLLALSACATLALAPITSSTVIAHEGEHAPGKGHTTAPETADGILQEIHKHHEQITATVTSKDLKPVHEHAEAIAELSKALPAKVAADKKARVEGAANNIAKLSGTLHDASDAGDQAKTEAELKKLDGVLKALDTQVK